MCAADKIFPNKESEVIVMTLQILQCQLLQSNTSEVTQLHGRQDNIWVTVHTLF